MGKDPYDLDFQAFKAKVILALVMIIFWLWVCAALFWRTKP